MDDVVAGSKAATKGTLSREKLLPLADGRVFTGRQALKVRLVDEMGGLYEAVQEAGHTAGIDGEVQASEVGSGGLLDSLFSASAEGAASSAGKALGRSFGAGVAEEIQARALGSQAPSAKSTVGQ